MATGYRPSHTDRTDVMALLDDLDDLYFDCMDDFQHPIHYLPAEVLDEIFQRCLPIDHLPILSSSEAPISLTQVCSIWRNIALSSPTLWTAVHIPIPSSLSEEFLYHAFKKRSAGATWWLSHVRRLNCPLTLSLHWPNALRYTFGRGEDFVRATIIGAASDLIRELDLHLPNDILKIVLNKPTYIFPRLEKVILRKGSNIEDTCLWETPSLRRVVWNGVMGNILNTELKWDSMEEITMDCAPERRSWFNYDDARALLQATCRSLLKLGIQLGDVPGPISVSSRTYSSTLIRAMQSRRGDSAPATGDPELYLPRLETLTLVVSTSQPQHSAPRLCKLLQLPALRTLSYAHHQINTRPPSQIQILEPHPLFILLSVQSHPVAITTLIIDAASISRTMFLGCMRLTPSLSRLWVKDNRPQAEVGGALVDHGMTMGDPDEEVVLDDLFLGDLLPTFCYDIPIEFSYDYDLLCPLLTDVRFDRAWFTLDALKNFVHTRLSLAAVGIASVEDWVDDFSEGPQVARLKSVHVGFAYQGAPGSDAGLEYELRESNVSVSISFAVEREDAPPAPRLFGVVDPKDGLRAIDEWM